MNAGTLPSSSEFKRTSLNLTIAVSLIGLAIVFSCLMGLLEFTSEQWTWFVVMVVGWATASFWPQMRTTERHLAPLSEYLDNRDSDEEMSETRRQAFASVIDLPRRNAYLGFFGWVIPNFLIGLVMAIRFPQWGAYEFATLVASGLAAGFVAGSVMLFVTKRFTQQTRDELTSELADPQERSALIRRLPLRNKLLVVIAGVAIVPVIFAVLLARTQATGAFALFTIDWQNSLLDNLEQQFDPEELIEDPKAAGIALIEDGNVFPAPVAAVVIDFSAPEASSLPSHLITHLASEVGSGLTRGDSREYPSSDVFSWRKLDERYALVASTPASALRIDTASSWFVYASLVLVAAGIAFGLAYLIANDLSVAMRALQVEADRMASGDLSAGAVFESEDELGDLSRSFATMGDALRTTVSRVAAAADRVEGTATEMATISESVSTVTASQVIGIREAARSMEAIDSQVKGIADSSQALNVSVEESSSTILELGAAGEELNDTASVLSSKVSEVSTSIEQMVASVKQVSENTEALSHAAIETSTSMEEMASSMREVDMSAEETGRLSDEVVMSAESGQVKVRQTIDGMNEIREATETAEQVIKSLGRRTKEIGAIVDVIDDVADETNLLALNAAIIAAQAGEHGRAFSVVADEIKDLADRVLASTKEIGTLISAVQDESGNAIGAIERGTQSVASGVDLSAEAGISLEEITRASRDSGTRIASIVSAVREQAKAAGHVSELMERVRTGVDEIRSAASEQEKGNQVVYDGSIAMREVAHQVRGTTEEQARGSGRIRESVDGVRDAVEQINSSLQEQSAACRSVVEFLEEVSSRTQSNEVSAKRMDEATKVLVREAEGLREDVHRFRI
jgi:methyl-accepting chemotaxis protein